MQGHPASQTDSTSASKRDGYTNRKTHDTVLEPVHTAQKGIKNHTEFLIQYNHPGILGASIGTCTTPLARKSGLHSFALFFLTVAENGLALVRGHSFFLERQVEVHVHGLGMPDVEIAVGLRRKSCPDLPRRRSHATRQFRQSSILSLM